MLKIVAFGHRKRSGKDTAARFLVTELRMRHPGLRVIKIGFASKVKSVAHDLYAWAGLRDEEFYEDERNEHLREAVLPLIGKTPREIWIGVGNGVRAAVGYDGTWLDYALNAHARSCDVLVFKDLRFPAEADGVRSRSGLNYRVDCPWAPVVDDGADAELANYAHWHGVIRNDVRDDYKPLYAQVAAIATEIMQ